MILAFLALFVQKSLALTIVVKPGDTLSSIAEEFDMPYEALAWHNRILNVDDLLPGDKLDIPINPIMPPLYDRWIYNLSMVGEVEGISTSRLRTTPGERRRNTSAPMNTNTEHAPRWLDAGGEVCFE